MLTQPTCRTATPRLLCSGRQNFLISPTVVIPSKRSAGRSLIGHLSAPAVMWLPGSFIRIAGMGGGPGWKPPPPRPPSYSRTILFLHCHLAAIGFYIIYAFGSNSGPCNKSTRWYFFSPPQTPKTKLIVFWKPVSASASAAPLHAPHGWWMAPLIVSNW